MASGKIRGIKIELSADATGILDSLKSLNGQIKSTSSQLKDVEKLLKLDPTNTELLTQKTQLLQEQIGNTKTKLDELKQAQANMDANGVDKNSEQYQALQREIIATKNELENLENTAGSGSATLAQVSVVTGEIGEKMTNVGEKMSIVSAGIVAFGTAAVAAFNEVDEGADIVITKTGATGEAAEALEEVYKTVGQNIVADWTDIGSAVGEINTRFKLTGDELESLSEEFLKFAQINDMDVTNSISGVDMAMKTFNTDQSEVNEVMGLLTKTSQDTGISMDTLLNLLQSSGPTFKEMGLDIYDSTELMGLFESAGLDSDTMMRGLSKAATYFSENGGMDMQEGLQDLIKRLQNSDTEAEATAEAYEIFGKKGGLAFITAAKEGKIGLDGLSDNFEGYSDVVDNTYQATLDGTDSIALAWQNLQLALSEVGEAVGKAIQPVVEKITELIKGFTDWFGSLDEGTQTTIVTVGALVAAIGPLLVVGGKVMTGISNITSTLSKMGTSTTGPIGIAIVATAALVGAVVGLKDALSNAYKEASPFTEAIEKMQSTNDNLARSIQNSQSAYENTATATESQAGAAKNLYDKLKDLMDSYDGTIEKQGEIESAVNTLNELVPGLGLSWDSVTNSLNKTNKEIYGNIEAMRAQAEVAALQNFYTESLQEQYEAQKNLQDSHSTLIDVIKEHGLTLETFNSLIADGKLDVQELQWALSGAGEDFFNLGNAADEVIDAFKNYDTATRNAEQVTENVNYAETELVNAMQNLEAATASITQSIASQYYNTFGVELPADLQIAINKAEAAGVQIPEDLANGILSNTISTEDAINQLVALTDKAQEAKNNGQKTGKAYTDNTASTIISGEKKVEQAAQDYVENLDVSDEAYDYGEKTGNSYDAGLDSQSANIEATAQDIGDSVIDGVDDVPGEMQETGDSSGSNLDSSFGSWKKTISGTVDEVFNFFYNTLGTMLPPKMYEWGSTSAEKFNSGLNLYNSNISTTASNMSIAVTNALSGLSSQMTTIGYNAGAGLYNGLASWQTYLYSLASAIATNISNTISSALQVNSPSRVMRRIGEYTGEGLAIGIEKSGQRAIKATENIAESMIGTMDGLNAINSNINSNVRETGTVNGSISNASVEAIATVLMNYLPYLAEDKLMKFDDGTVAGKLAPAMSEALGALDVQEARGWAS